MISPDFLIPGVVLTYLHMTYAQACELQDSLAVQRFENRCLDTLVLTEHEPVLTLGRTTRSEHWERRWPELREMGIHVHQTGRGGSVTYHGPGQMIGYPILRLRNFCSGPKTYVQKLEEVLIRTLADWGITGHRHESFRGVWVKTSPHGFEKIASLGVRISKGITMHGFALNVNIDLHPFSLLTPCGIEHCVMTSMEKLLKKPVDGAHVREQVSTHFSDLFRIEWTEKK